VDETATLKLLVSWVIIFKTKYKIHRQKREKVMLKHKNDVKDYHYIVLPCITNFRRFHNFIHHWCTLYTKYSIKKNSNTTKRAERLRPAVVACGSNSVLVGRCWINICVRTIPVTLTSKLQDNICDKNMWYVNHEQAKQQAKLNMHYIRLPGSSQKVTTGKL